jgi:D-alanyl-D-alanine carboxypeptidase
MANAEEIITREVGSGRSPSVQYCLFNADSIRESVSHGAARLSPYRTVDAHTTYNAYSVTKTFTALAVLQLAEQGKVDIDQPAKHYLPGFPYGERITIRHLLTHTAGLPNPNPLNWIHLAAENDAFDRDGYFSKVMEKHPAARSAPNQRYAYSNLGYILLGQLLEHVTGQTYEDYITEHIIRRLGLGDKDLSFAVSDSQVHATGYQKRWSLLNLLLGLFIDKSRFMDKPEGPWRPFRTFYVNGAPYGGLVGRPEAFVRYIQALLKDESPLISTRYRKLLFEENLDAQGKATGMCLSWFKGQLHGHVYYTHAGGGGGYYVEIRVYPGLKIGSVVFFNRTGTSDIRFLDKLDAAYINSQQAAI